MTIALILFMAFLQIVTLVAIRRRPKTLETAECKDCAAARTAYAELEKKIGDLHEQTKAHNQHYHPDSFQRGSNAVFWPIPPVQNDDEETIVPGPEAVRPRKPANQSPSGGRQFPGNQPTSGRPSSGGGRRYPGAQPSDGRPSSGGGRRYPGT